MNYRQLLSVCVAGILCIQMNAQDAEFIAPPKDSRPFVWWHWINSNITKEGLRKDLEWMDRIGVGGFHQFDAGGAMMQMVPSVVKPLPYLGQEWKDAFSMAVSMADSLGMEVGIASAPGWSSTGGPWVEPADGMKKLSWRSIEVKGGSSQNITLPEPFRNIGKFLNCDPGTYAVVFDKMYPWYEDIAVVAVRIPEEEKSLQELGAEISSSGGSFSVDKLSDGDIFNGSELPLNQSGSHSWIQYSFPEKVTVRSLTLCAGTGTISDGNYLQCSDDGISWKDVCKISPCAVAQITMDIPETTAKYFRLMVVNPQADMSYAAFGVPVIIPTGTPIHEWKLSTVYKVDHAEDKAGFTASGSISAYPTPETSSAVSEVVDLTSQVKDGVLTWNVPDGKWRIYRFGASLTGKMNHPAPDDATGLEVDKLDLDAWSRYFHKYLDMYKEASGGLLGQRGVQYLMLDSYEAEQMTWTPKMREVFKNARGYDLTSWLPALAGEILESSRETEEFLFDWRETLGEIFASNYDRINDFIKEYGMKGRYTESHEGGRVFVGDGMDLKRTAAVPMSAIWMTSAHSSINHQADIRESASVAHIYGQNIVAGESFTSYGVGGRAYGFYPGNMKETADIALMSGLNRFVIHESAHQPLDDLRPGLGLMIFGQWFNRHETWAEYARYWMDYLARSCYMLRKGRAVADVLWYYGEDTNITNEYGQSLPDVPDSYSYDFVNPHALLNCISVKDGKAVTSTGMSYKVLVLGSHTSYMSLEILKKMYSLVTGGVFLIGKEPVCPAGRGEDIAEFNYLVASIWHTGRKNVWTGSVPEGIKFSGVEPDFVSSSSSVRFVHRVDGDKNIYWVRNFGSDDVDATLSLRDSKGVITILDPESGKQLYGVYKDSTLHLKAGQALFIVADPDAEPFAEPASKQKVGDISLDGTWRVTFDGLSAPSDQQFTSLLSYTESEDPQIKYFSGTATYTNTFKVSKKDIDSTLSIDLGQVGQMADVYINGEHAGFLWHAPYDMEFTGKLKKGKNTIEVKVVNLWVNRLVGDMQPGAEKTAYTVIPFYQAQSPLLPSGLIGPVKLELLR